MLYRWSNLRNIYVVCRGYLDSVDWNGGMDWNGMMINWMSLVGSHLIIITTFEQRPPKFNEQIRSYQEWLKLCQHTSKKRPPFHLSFRLSTEM